jgi:hypothetical protein
METGAVMAISYTGWEDFNEDDDDAQDQAPTALQLDPQALGRVPPQKTMATDVEAPDLRPDPRGPSYDQLLHDRLTHPFGEPEEEPPATPLRPDPRGPSYDKLLRDERLVVTNPLAVLGSAGSAATAAFWSLPNPAGVLTDPLNPLGTMVRGQAVSPTLAPFNTAQDYLRAGKAGYEELKRAPFVSSVSELKSTMEEARRRGLDLSPWTALAMDLAIDPTNLIGGNPLVDLSKGGVAMASVGVPYALMRLKGLSTKLVAKGVANIPEKGWDATRILAQMKNWGVTKAEMEQSGVVNWLNGKLTAAKAAREAGQPALPTVVTRAEFEKFVSENSLDGKLYERWYGANPDLQGLINDIGNAHGELQQTSYSITDRLVNPESYYDRRVQGHDFDPWLDALGRVPTHDEVRAKVRLMAPWLAEDPDRVERGTEAVSEYAANYVKKQALQTRLDALGGAPPPLQWGEQYTLPGGENFREFTIGLKPGLAGDTGDIHITTGHHYRDPNMLFHARLGDYWTDEVYKDGVLVEPKRKVLVVNELQSDMNHTASVFHERIVDDMLDAFGAPEGSKGLGLSKKETMARTYAQQYQDWQQSLGRVPTHEEIAAQLGTLSGGRMQYGEGDEIVDVFHRMAETNAPSLTATLDKEGYGLERSPFRPHEEIDAQSYLDHSGRQIVPEALPYKGQKWQDVAMRRILTYAAQNGYDEVAWTTGLQQSIRWSDAARDLVKLRLTPHGGLEGVDAAGRSVRVPNRSYSGSYTGPEGFNQLARKVGPETARALWDAPQTGTQFHYDVTDANGNLVAHREFPTRTEADAARLEDLKTYHPAEEPPSPPDWYDLGGTIQERVAEYHRNQVLSEPAVAEEARTKAKTYVDEQVAQQVENEVRNYTRKRMTREYGRAGLQPLRKRDALLLDRPTFMADTPRPWDPEPLFEQRGFLKYGRERYEQPAGVAEIPAYQARTAAQQPPSVRTEILRRAKSDLDLDLDPDSLALEEAGGRGPGRIPEVRDPYEYYDEGTYPTPRLNTRQLRTRDGQPLDWTLQHQIEGIAEEAVEGIQKHYEEVLAHYRKAADPDALAAAALREVSDYEEAKPEYWAAQMADNRWYDLNSEAKLKVAQEMGIPEAMPPEAHPLAPYTGDVSHVEYPEPKREIALSRPTSYLKKGFEQSYDGTMTNTMNALGKAFGAEARKIPIRTHAHSGGGYEVFDGPLKLTVSDEGTIRQWKMSDDHKELRAWQAERTDEKSLRRAEAEAKLALKQWNEEREVWAIPLKDHAKFVEQAKQGFTLPGFVPPLGIGVGSYLWSKGQRMRVTAVHDDGSFDADPAPLPRRTRTVVRH